MDVTPLIASDAQVIQSYADGGFRISGTFYDGAMLVGVKVSAPWPETAGKGFTDLCLDDFAPLIDQAGDLDVVLLGTGAKMAFLPPALKAQLREAGLAIEVMDTPAACRTFNVLMAEERRVIAALLPCL